MLAERRRIPLYLWLLCILQSRHISAFNLDTQSPLRRSGEPGSLFGFSLAMHHQLQPTDQKVLLIGSPRARATASQRVNITGGLYRCPFTTLSHCERIQTSSNEFAAPEERLENQWLGVRVRSQGPGGKVVVCAHRYQWWWSEEWRQVTGRCLVLGEDLQDESDERLFCNAEKRKRGLHERFAFCQQGLSVAFAKDGQNLLFGAPGAYDWKGIVRMEPVDDLQQPRYETGNDNVLDPRLIPLHISSYLGFSLDSGMALTGNGELTIVAGAPRAGHSGEVVLLRRDAEGGQRSLTVDQRLTGPGLASSFGYDLTVVDLNADGWEDIVVGAPQFSLRDGEVGGAVYVYINRAGGKEWGRIEPVRLHGKKDSMFGLAVENIGDVNQDSYPDIAVGAPYDGAGRVYLYHGSSEGINRKPTQILKGKDYNIILFGYSLAGNMDVDENGYPDIAVGSLSDAVFVYRARPVINIRSSLTIIPGEIDLKRAGCDQKHCILMAQACFSYTAHPATYNPKMNVRYVLETDAQRRRWGLPSRVGFQTGSRAQGSLMLRGQGREECVQTQLSLLRDIQDRLNSIPISVSWSLSSSRPKLTQGSLPDLQPILNDLQPNKTVTEFRFLNAGCGSDKICHSNLQLHSTFCSRQNSSNQNKFTPLNKVDGMAVISPGDNEIAMEITVTNKGGDDAHESRLLVRFPDSVSYSSSLSEHNSVSCSADGNGTLAKCPLGNPFKRDAQVTFYIILITDRLSLSTTDVNITLQLETISKQNITAMEAKARVIFELQLQVFGLARPSQVSFSGEVRGESTMTAEEEIGTLVQYEFRVSNLGRPLDSFAAVSLNIQWPRENTQGKWLLYLVQVKREGVQAIPCTPVQEISPIKHIQASSGASRRKRQTAQESELEALSSEDGVLSIFGKKRKYKTLTCADELKCVVIKCPLQGLDSTAVIVLRSRLWNSTFLEEYGSLNYLDIVVNASLSLDESRQNIGLRKSQTQVRLTVFPERKAALYSRVPWWVILLSVLAGLLLLALVVFLLRKLGCFKCPMCDKDKQRYHSVNT